MSSNIDGPIFKIIPGGCIRRVWMAAKLLVGGKALALLCYHKQSLPLPLVAAFLGLLTGFFSAFAILVRTRHSIETHQRKESSPSLFWQPWTFSGCVPSNPVPLPPNRRAGGRLRLHGRRLALLFGCGGGGACSRAR